MYIVDCTCYERYISYNARAVNVNVFYRNICIYEQGATLILSSILASKNELKNAHIFVIAKQLESKMYS